MNSVSVRFFVILDDSEFFRVAVKVKPVMLMLSWITLIF